MVIVSCGALTGVVVVLVQRAAAGHVGSPPPLTVAVFTAGLAAAAVGVTGIVNALVALTARPAGIVQVTVWPAAVQPAGNVPIRTEERRVGEEGRGAGRSRGPA